MHEIDLRKIVEEVVKTLIDKGFLKTGPCACEGPSGITNRVTTIGTAGKVFSDDWHRGERSAAPRPQSALTAKGDAEHTGAPNCPHCDKGTVR